jgi:hypothetical protein
MNDYAEKFQLNLYRVDIDKGNDCDRIQHRDIRAGLGSAY